MFSRIPRISKPTRFKATALHAALFTNNQFIFPAHYSSFSDFRKNPALQPDALAIRNTLIEVASKTRKTVSSYFKAMIGVTPAKNELFDFRHYLSKEQLDYVKKLDASCHQLILAEHLPLLKTFYTSKQSEQSLLGAFYRQITFEQMVHRFIQAKYTTAYQDGRMLEYRYGHEQEQKPIAHLSDREKFLAVSTSADIGGLYKYYLTIEEAALSHLVFASGYFLAVNNGIRPSKGGAALSTPSDCLKKAHLGPILVTYAVGPEFREGQTLHYDALMCIEYDNEKPGHPQYDRRQVVLSQAGFSSVIEALYGTEFPGGPKSREHCDVVPFTVSGKLFHSENAYFYINAYKQRLRHVLKQTLIANELFMPQPGTCKLKGISLGAFGINALQPLLEKLYLDVLKELLQTLALTKINRIELLNFPSMMAKYNSMSGDIDYYMNHTSGIRAPEPTLLDSPIPVEHLLAACLSQTDDIYISTQICGDSISAPGNEAQIGLPPSSSDEATMFYALAGLTSMCEAIDMPFDQLARKIVVTDGKNCQTLAGEKAVMDLSCVDQGHIKHDISLMTEPTPLEEAVRTMDALNTVQGLSAALEPTSTEDSWRTVIQMSPQYDRNHFFEVINQPDDQKDKSSSPKPTKR